MITLGAGLHYLLSIGQGSVALMLWHSAMPRQREAYGVLRSYCIWLLGIILALGATINLNEAMLNASANWELIGRDLLLIIYSVCRWRHSLHLSDCTWSKIPSKRENGNERVRTN